MAFSCIILNRMQNNTEYFAEGENQHGDNVKERFCIIRKDVVIACMEEGWGKTTRMMENF